MFDTERFVKNIFKITSHAEFELLSLELFKYQSKNNQVYAKYLELLGINADQVSKLDEIPFLPIRFYKSYEVKTGKWDPEYIFMSSGTTGQVRSRNFIRSLDFYRSISYGIFRSFYGNLEDYIILALLPSYMEKGNSSLIYMVDNLINETGNPQSGFFLSEHKEIVTRIETAQKDSKKVILFGVTFALLDMAEQIDAEMSNVTIIETGGMKGRGEEPTRNQVHQRLSERFAGAAIHSEYGMTELCSQAYSFKRGHFKCPGWMKVLVRDVTDPFSYIPPGSTGGMNVIDLANIDTCAFIETEDLGRVNGQDQFEVLGRFDNSEIRGCNIMVS